MDVPHNHFTFAFWTLFQYNPFVDLFHHNDVIILCKSFLVESFWCFLKELNGMFGG